MEQGLMSAIDHLSDLRKRIIYVLIALVVLLGASLAFVSHIYGYLIGPIHRLGVKLVVVSPGEVITVYLKIAGFVAIGLVLPFALYQLWLFIAPGLLPKERRYTVRLLPVAFVMFLLGVAFAWFFIFPTILRFLILLSEQHFNVMIRADMYFSFLTNICLPFGFIFELPIVVIFLTRIGIVSPKLLRKMRRFAYLIAVILGVLISPPELISHLSVVVPIILLYELSIFLSALTHKRRQKVMDAEDEAERAASRGAHGDTN